MTHDELRKAGDMLAEHLAISSAIRSWEDSIRWHEQDAHFAQLCGVRLGEGMLDAKEFRNFVHRNLAALRVRQAELGARIAAL